jgi:hypothetical protein
MSQAELQIQSGNRWITVERCGGDAVTLAIRLDGVQRAHPDKRVRAVEAGTGRILDIR